MPIIARSFFAHWGYTNIHFGVSWFYHFCIMPRSCGVVYTVYTTSESELTFS